MVLSEMNSIENANGKVHGLRSAELPDLESGKPVGAVDEADKQPATRRRRRFRFRRPVYVFVLRSAVMLLIISGIVGAAALIWYYMGWIFLLQIAIVIALAYFIAGKYYEWVYVAIMTLPRDFVSVIKYIRILVYMKIHQRKNNTVADIFQQNVLKHPNKAALVFEDEEWTFTQVEEYSNRIANVFKSHGYKKGDVVALFLENKPEFVCTWLGLSKLGVIVPLINTNQRLAPLVHSITISKSQAIIFGVELSDAIREVLEQIESTVALYELSSSTSKHVTGRMDLRFQNLNVLFNDALATPPVVQDKPLHHDHLVYIYTSGTTGLPKAAVISNSRYIFIAAGMHFISGFKPNDKYYTPLPLYHTAGGCMTIGQMLLFGSTVVIRKKFSASSFFPDCRKYKCTIAQYIGEMCRYILAVPRKPEDTEHNLRMIFGNGLRPQIWNEFVERFNIPRVAEFYGATEGNANIVNVDNTVGSIGFVSRILPFVYPISIIKVDQLTGEPIRDARGLCMTCKANEPGAFIGKITSSPTRAFLGYVDKSASQKKVIHNVFRMGECAFLSGDILVADRFGNLFFKDRTGDTFRWKGENVSTSEVEAVISNLIAYRDIVVYGVEITGQEGKAGMAAILDPDSTLDLSRLSEELVKVLPSYARPIFIRIMRKIDMTGTYKLKKNDLQKEGFNPSTITDNIYYLNNKGIYTLVTKDIYEDIMNGTIRL